MVDLDYEIPQERIAEDKAIWQAAVFGDGQSEIKTVDHFKYLAGFACLDFDLAKLDEFMQACISAGVVYGLGAKDKTPWHALPIDFEAIDCSGWVRVAVHHASGFKLKDGSWIQGHQVDNFLDADGKEFKETSYEMCANRDNLVRLAVYYPVPGKVGHIWLVVNGLTYESHGGKGPNMRRWDDPVLKRIVSKTFVLGGQRRAV